MHAHLLRGLWIRTGVLRLQRSRREQVFPRQLYHHEVVPRTLHNMPAREHSIVLRTFRNVGSQRRPVRSQEDDQLPVGMWERIHLLLDFSREFRLEP